MLKNVIKSLNVVCYLESFLSNIEKFHSWRTGTEEAGGVDCTPQILNLLFLLRVLENWIDSYPSVIAYQ